MGESIPVLELPPANASVASWSAELGQAVGEFGFVGLRNHGVSEPLQRDAYRVSAAFFALPEATKRRYHRPGGAGQRGYTPFGVEVGKDAAIADLKEFWHVGPEHDDRPESPCPNLWPEEVPQFRPVLRALYAELFAIGRVVLRGLSAYLGEEESYFESRVQNGDSILRALHYPPIEAAAGAVRAAAHEDIDLLTLLVGAGEPGLEILARSGEWIPVTAIEGTILCNVGDMLERITLGVLPSTTHRVVNPPAPWDRKARYSLPFFLHPRPDVLLESLPSCVDRSGRSAEPAIQAGEFLRQRLREIGLLPDSRS